MAFLLFGSACAGGAQHKEGGVRDRAGSIIQQLDEGEFDVGHKEWRQSMVGHWVMLTHGVKVH